MNENVLIPVINNNLSTPLFSKDPQNHLLQGIVDTGATDMFIEAHDAAKLFGRNFMFSN